MGMKYGYDLFREKNNTIRLDNKQPLATVDINYRLSCTQVLEHLSHEMTLSVQNLLYWCNTRVWTM